MSSQICDLKIRDRKIKVMARLRLLFVSMQQATFIQILAAQTVPGPWHCFQAFLEDRLSAVNALAVFSIGDAMQGGIDRFQQLPVIGRHRHHQLFGVSVRCHVRRILRGFRVTFPAVGFGSLHLAHQAFTPGQ